MGRYDRSGAEDPACAMAHGDLPGPADGRTVVVVFASPVGRSLLHFARDVGFRTVLVEPEPARLSEADRGLAGVVLTGPEAARLDPTVLGGDADVVVTDHHRRELGEILRDVLAALGRRHRQPAAHRAARGRAGRAGRAGGRHCPGPPPGRAEHRLAHPAGDRIVDAGRPDRRPQRPTRRVRLSYPRLS